MCTRTRARARGDDVHGILCIQAQSLVGPGSRVRRHWRTHRQTHTVTHITHNFRICVLCRAGGVVKPGDIFYPRCSHICPRALCGVCTCVCDTEWDPLPLRHLPQLSLQSPPPPPRSLATSLLEKPPGAEHGASHPFGGAQSWDPPRDRYSPAPRKDYRKPHAARAFLRSGPLALGQLAAGGKGRGPARPLTHPVRACPEGAGPNRPQQQREPIPWSQAGWKVKEGEQLSK